MASMAAASSSGNLLRSIPLPKPFFPTRPFSTISFPFSFPSLQTVRSLPPNQFQNQAVNPDLDSDLDLDLLPEALRDIVALFRSVPDPKAKYQQLLHYGGRLPRLDPRFKTDRNRVRGCVSQVWVRAFPDPADPAAVRFEADSDSALTKGLAALLVIGLSGSPARSIARVPPEFVQLLGLRQSLTPSRNNGFLNMLELMKIKSLEINEIKEDPDGDGNSGAASELPENDEIVIDDDKRDDVMGVGSGGGRAERIRVRLEEGLSPVVLEVEDVSYQHAGHAAVRGSGDGETHFNLRIVSREFEGKSLVKRHRVVYDLLQEELRSGLHAVSISAKTPAEAGL